MITNALGSNQEVKLDVLYFDVKEGDRLLLCSDGISMLIPEDQMKSIVNQADPEQVSQQLINEANRRGSPDNITAVVLQIQKVEERNKKSAPPPSYLEPKSVTIGSTMSGVGKIEEAFPTSRLGCKTKASSFVPLPFMDTGIFIFNSCCWLVFALWR